MHCRWKWWPHSVVMRGLPGGGAETGVDGEGGWHATAGKHVDVRRHNALPPLHRQPLPRRPLPATHFRCRPPGRSGSSCPRRHHHPRMHQQLAVGVRRRCLPPQALQGPAGCGVAAASQARALPCWLRRRHRPPCCLALSAGQCCNAALQPRWTRRLCGTTRCPGGPSQAGVCPAVAAAAVVAAVSGVRAGAASAAAVPDRQLPGIRRRRAQLHCWCGTRLCCCPETTASCCCDGAVLRQARDTTQSALR